MSSHTQTLKLAYIVDEYPPFFRGGLGTYAMEITPRLIKEAVSPFVCSRNTGDDPENGDYKSIPVYRPKLMNIHSLLSLFSPGDVIQWAPADQNFFMETLLFCEMAAQRIIHDGQNQSRFDAVAVHDWLSAPAGFLVQENLHIPLIMHFHSTEQGRTIGGSQIIRDIEREAAKRADAIITVSHAMKNELISFGYPAEKINVVYNGVDTAKYNMKRYPASILSPFKEKIGVSSRPVILFIGRLTWVKGAEELVQAMPEILSQVPDAVLVLIGVGELETAIRTHITDLNLEDHVIFIPELISEDERLLYYAACDVAVFPSKYEPFGIVCTEAMSMGKPVVVGATGTNGFREQIIPTGSEQCGFHVNPWDPSDIAKYVNIFLQNKDLRKQCGKNARKRVLEQFRWEHIAKQTAEIYQSVQQR
ncbi:MAG: glycosyltransferase family 4 protein [Methanomicrobiales archaeon]|jgi:glycosyltransferase involved in cell wall biosynthesis|nr:glycosyltransferase family 4 protein [Methanomicrobiales archaeon]